MQNLIKDRIVKLREEIAEISEANRLYLGAKKDACWVPAVTEANVRDAARNFLFRDGVIDA